LRREEGFCWERKRERKERRRGIEVWHALRCVRALERKSKYVYLGNFYGLEQDPASTEKKEEKKNASKRSRAKTQEKEGGGFELTSNVDLTSFPSSLSDGSLPAARSLFFRSPPTSTTSTRFSRSRISSHARRCFLLLVLLPCLRTTSRSSSSSSSSHRFPTRSSSSQRRSRTLHSPLRCCSSPSRPTSQRSRFSWRSRRQRSRKRSKRRRIRSFFRCGFRIRHQPTRSNSETCSSIRSRSFR